MMKYLFFHTMQLILANFVFLLYFFKTDVYIGNKMLMLDTVKQSTYVTINEVNMQTLEIVLFYKKSHWPC